MEMVPGMAHKKKGDEISFHNVWLEALTSRCPMWWCRTFTLDSSQYGLPQSRKRNYTVGFNRLRLPVEPRPPPQGLQGSGGYRLQDALHPGLPPFRESECTEQQRRNLFLYKHLAQERLSNSAGAIACVAADRNPRKDFGQWVRADGMVSTLRTCNELEWVFIFFPDGSLRMSRPVHPYERFALQGFQVTHCAGHLLTKSEVLLTTGNAMSVPVVGAVATEILRAMASWGLLAPSRLRPPLPCLHERARALERQRKRFALSTDIAFLDGWRLRLEGRAAKQPRVA